MNRVVIVGASAGGLVTAEALRRGGYRGVLTLVGDEPHPPYDRPPLSKQILTGEWEPGRLPLRREEDIETLGLDLRLGVAATGPVRVAGRHWLEPGNTEPFAAVLRRALSCVLSAVPPVPPVPPGAPGAPRNL